MLLKYKISPPSLIRNLFPGTIWRVKTNEKVLFITFDDGPVPEVTPWVIDCLKKYKAVATFFCVGDNVRKYPEIFKSLTDNEMAVGNHSFSHKKTKRFHKIEFFKDVDKSMEFVKSAIFRPPHGRINPWWLPELKRRFDKIVMWDILSLDYDKNVSAEDVVNNVITNIRPGSVIVFHDSLKSWDRMRYALPKVLEFAIENGYKTKIIKIVNSK